MAPVLLDEAALPSVVRRPATVPLLIAQNRYSAVRALAAAGVYPNAPVMAPADRVSVCQLLDDQHKADALTRFQIVGGIGTKTIDRTPGRWIHIECVGAIVPYHDLCAGTPIAEQIW